MSFKRGALIVIEGMDRTGKSTQCKRLVYNLERKFFKAIYANFPNRTTEIGKIINSYLTSKINLSDETIHLLFAANRREQQNFIENTLASGTSIVMDRYSYSGVAFSAAKGLDIEWCKSPDAGLPLPDKVFFLTMPVDSIQYRGNFGEERYENLEFQKKVLNAYEKLQDKNWDIIDASRSIEEIEQKLLQTSIEVIENTSGPIGKQWM